MLRFISLLKLRVTTPNLPAAYRRARHLSFFLLTDPATAWAHAVGRWRILLRRGGLRVTPPGKLAGRKEQPEPQAEMPSRPVAQRAAAHAQPERRTERPEAPAGTEPTGFAKANPGFRPQPAASRESKPTGREASPGEDPAPPFDARPLPLRGQTPQPGCPEARQKGGPRLEVAPREIAVSSMDEKLLAKIVAVVEAHLEDSDFGPDAFAREVGVSRMQLHRKITALTGMATTQFVRTMRLKRAAQLLEAKAGNVKEIAWQVGFESVPYFSRCFKEQFGVTASAYQGQFVVEPRELAWEFSITGPNLCSRSGAMVRPRVA